MSMQVGVLHSDAGFHLFLFITHTLALVGTRENEIFLWLPSTYSSTLKTSELESKRSLKH